MNDIKDEIYEEDEKTQDSSHVEETQTVQEEIKQEVPINNQPNNYYQINQNPNYQQNNYQGQSDNNAYNRYKFPDNNGNVQQNNYQNPNQMPMYGQQQNNTQVPNQVPYTGYVQQQQVNANYQAQNQQMPYQGYGQYQAPFNTQQQTGQNYYSYNPKPEKSKHSLGVKIFIGVMAAAITLSAISIPFVLAYQLVNDATVQNDNNNDSNNNGNNNGGDNFDDGSENPFDDGFEINPDDFPFGGDWDTSDDDESLGIQAPDYVPDIDIPENAEGFTLNAEPNTEELDPQVVYDKVIESTVVVEAEIAYTNGDVYISKGSGVMMSSDGFVITNSHVIDNTKSCLVTVKTNDGVEHEAIVVGLDRATDIAVLKIDGTGYTPAEFGDSDDLDMAQWVMAVGNPNGFEGSVSRGIVSGLDRTEDYYSNNSAVYIQTDTAINHGNSGGPLVNMYGQVIGINTFKYVVDDAEGLGFAISSNFVKEIVDDLITQGYTSGRVRMGITARDASVSGYGSGVEIIEITEDSVFLGTDAKAGDIIVAIDNFEITDMYDMTQLFLSYSPGDEAEVTLNTPSGEAYTVHIVFLADQGETH